LKNDERDAALNKHRRSGRKVLAWGEPILGDVQGGLGVEDNNYVIGNCGAAL
jgi:hypothetical protein